jgi:hypothetical protein
VCIQYIPILALVTLGVKSWVGCLCE